MNEQHHVVAVMYPLYGGNTNTNTHTQTHKYTHTQKKCRSREQIAKTNGWINLNMASNQRNCVKIAYWLVN